MRFAVAFYTHSMNGPNFFEISQFRDLNHFEIKCLYKSNEMKAEILNLDWDEKSHKLVLTLAKEGLIENVLNFLLNVMSFLSSEDEVSKQIKYKNIHIKKVDFKKSQGDQSIINQIFSERFLSLQAEDLCQEDYLRQLYFLKRNSFSSSAEYKISRKKKVFPENYDKLKSLRIYANYEKYKKESEFAYPKFESLKQIDLNFKSEILEPTRNVFLISAKHNDGSGTWIEILDNKSALNRILDIHLTAEYLVEHFRKLKSSLKIKIAKINRLLCNHLLN
jgi:hypothetical protein